MHVAVNRTPPHNAPRGQGEFAQNEPLLDEEKINVGQALPAYTLDAAYANGYDDVSGSIEAGKSADFTLLDRDPFEVVPGDLGTFCWRCLCLQERLFTRGREVFAVGGWWPTDTLRLVGPVRD